MKRLLVMCLLAVVPGAMLICLIPTPALAVDVDIGQCASLDAVNALFAERAISSMAFDVGISMFNIEHFTPTYPNSGIRLPLDADGDDMSRVGRTSTACTRRIGASVGESTQTTYTILRVDPHLKRLPFYTA